MTYVGRHDEVMLKRAVTMFEDFLLYLNHLGLSTEEVSAGGELYVLFSLLLPLFNGNNTRLGNAVQAFTHVTLISAAYNLSRTLEGYQGM